MRIRAYEIHAEPMLSELLTTTSVTANVSKDSQETLKLDAVSPFPFNASYVNREKKAY